MQKRLFWPDLVRVAACLLVVADHAAATPLYYLNRIPDREWTVALLYGATARCCVPLFFMVGGFLFYAQKPGPLMETVKKRVARLFWPLLFYSILGAFWRNIVLDPLPHQGTFLLHKSYYHLWFFYAMIAVSLLAAIVRPLPEKAWTGAAFLIALMLLLPGNLKPFGADTDFFLLNDLGVYFCYFLLGYYLGGTEAKNAPLAGFAWLLAYLAATAAIILGVSITSRAAGRLDLTFFQYSAIPVIAQSVFLFQALRSFSARLEVIPVFSRAVSSVAALSLGIYGLHAFVLDFLMERMGLSGLAPSTLAGIPARFIAAFSGAFILALLLKKLDRRGYVV